MARARMGLTLACGQDGCAGRVHFTAGTGRRAVGRCDRCRASYLLDPPTVAELSAGSAAPDPLEDPSCRPSPPSAAPRSRSLLTAR